MKKSSVLTLYATRSKPTQLSRIDHIVTEIAHKPIVAPSWIYQERPHLGQERLSLVGRILLGHTVAVIETVA